MSFQIRRLGEERRRPFPWKKLLGMGLLVARPLLDFAAAMRERREREQRTQRLLAIGIAGVTAAVIILLTGWLLLRIGALSLPSLLEKAGSPLARDEQGLTNILLLGQGNEDHDGIDLTDTIIVASIAPGGETPSVVLLSLPRDLHFLHTENMGAGKLNTFWRDFRITLQREGKERPEAELRALQEVAKEVGKALGVPMHYAVKVDFTAFEKVVDSIDGIDIEVAETIHDTEFPGPNYTYETFHIDAGPQHLDGATALKYARSRETTSDFDRSKRQQQILRAFGEKARSHGLLKQPRKILELLSVLAEHVETNLTQREFISLAHAGMELSPERVLTMQLNDVNGLYGEQLFPGGLLYAPPRDLFEGASVLLPVSIPEFPVTWKQVQTLGHLFFRERELYLGKPRIAVLNAGAPEGSARKVAREFIKFGFDVANVGNFPGKQEKERSFIASAAGGEKEEVATFFAHFLALPEEPLPEDAKAESFGDIAIILGEDYVFRPFQDLPFP